MVLLYFQKANDKGLWAEIWNDVWLYAMYDDDDDVSRKSYITWVQQQNARTKMKKNTANTKQNTNWMRYTTEQNVFFCSWEREREKIWIVRALLCATGRTGLKHNNLQLCCGGCLNMPLYSIAMCLHRPRTSSSQYTQLYIYLRIDFFLALIIYEFFWKNSEYYDMKTSIIIARLNQRILYECVTQWCGSNNQKASTLMKRKSARETNQQTNKQINTPDLQNKRNCTLRVGSFWRFPSWINQRIWMKIHLKIKNIVCNRRSFILQREFLCNLYRTSYSSYLQWQRDLEMPISWVFFKEQEQKRVSFFFE